MNMSCQDMDALGVYLESKFDSFLNDDMKGLWDSVDSDLDQVIYLIFFFFNFNFLKTFKAIKDIKIGTHTWSPIIYFSVECIILICLFILHYRSTKILDF